MLIDLAVPYDAVRCVERVKGRPRRHPRRMRLVGSGIANVRIHLQPETVLATPFGARHTEWIDIGLDDPTGFERALNARNGERVGQTAAATA